MARIVEMNERFTTVAFTNRRGEFDSNAYLGDEFLLKVGSSAMRQLYEALAVRYAQDDREEAAARVAGDKVDFGVGWSGK